MIARKLGVRAECTPKVHWCGMAGEGIEYDWSYCKGKYRSQPLAEKKTCDSFKLLVKEVTSWTFLTRTQAMQGSARARSYISGYLKIHFDKSSLLMNNNNNGHAVTRNGDRRDEIVLEEEEPAEPDATVTTIEGQDDEAPWKLAAGEVISMDIIKKAKKQYHSHCGMNSFEKGLFIIRHHLAGSANM
jgi:hypothetical protein